MKDAEDEAFDDLAKRQGDWGGGYQAKRAMAANKTQENVPLYVSKTAFRSWGEFASDYERGFIDGMQKQSASFSNGRRWGKTSLIGLLEKRMPMARIKELEAQFAQPAQEPVAAMDKINSDFDEEYKKSSAVLAKYRIDDDDDDTQVYQVQQLYTQGWNAALDEAANRISEIAAFPKTTQDSFAVFIRELKK